MALIRGGGEGILEGGMERNGVMMMVRAMVLGMAAAVLAAGTAAAQRVEFQRQKFDRSRFARPGAAAVETPAAEPAATEEPAAPAAGTGTGTDGGTSWGNNGGGWNNQGQGQSWGNRPGGPNGQGGTNEVLASGVPRALAEAPKFELVPKKWFDKASDWETAKALQRESGACILVYFKNPADSSQKGLCSWFETKAGAYTHWRKAMPYFIKVQITLPGNNETRALAATFGFKSTPAWYVVRPDAPYPKRLPVIKYALGGKDPEPMPERELIPALHGLCPPAYDNLF